MGKKFGTIALVFGIIGIVLVWTPFWIRWINQTVLYVSFIWLMVIIAIVFGVLGIKKDDLHGPAIGGLVFGTIILFIYIVFFFGVPGQL
ncbi:MAG: hypothetical protein WBH31_04920 [Promethearchaeia archaeon]